MTKLPAQIVILAGGPAFERPRHLKWLWRRLSKVIDIPVRESLKVTEHVHVLVDSANSKVFQHIARNYPGVNILFPDGPLMMDSFKRAFTFDDYKSGKVIIAGDLVDIKSQDILNFYNCMGQSALPLLPRPFKKERIYL